MNDTLEAKMQSNRYLYAAAMTDQGYRDARALGRIIPERVTCHCGLAATFQDDTLAARYECERGHAIAAMWADPAVAGEEVAR